MFRVTIAKRKIASARMPGRRNISPNISGGSKEKKSIVYT
jgi:hypothetical protein